MERSLRLLISIVLVLGLVFTLSGCNKNNEDVSEKQPKEEEVQVEKKENEENKETTTNKKIKIKIGGLKGPTSMGMIKLIEEQPELGNNIESEYVIESAPDVLVGKVINGEVDIATLPTNVAAVIYNKTKGKYKAASVNTLGVLYLLSKNEIDSIQELKGKKVYISGKGATPDYAFKYLLKANGLNPDKDLELIFEAEHSTVAALLLAGDAEYAVLPEPFVTTTLMKNQDLNVGLNFQKEWEAVAGGSSTLAMTTLVVKKELIENNKEALDTFLSSYQESVNWVNNNAGEAGMLIEKHGILPKAKVAEMAIPKCNIVFIGGNDAAKLLDGFYKILFDFNPKSVGGILPDEEFYYKD